MCMCQMWSDETIDNSTVHSNNAQMSAAVKNSVRNIQAVKSITYSVYLHQNNVFQSFDHICVENATNRWN